MSVNIWVLPSIIAVQIRWLFEIIPVPSWVTQFIPLTLSWKHLGTSWTGLGRFWAGGRWLLVSDGVWGFNFVSVREWIGILVDLWVGRGESGAGRVGLLLWLGGSSGLALVGGFGLALGVHFGWRLLIVAWGCLGLKSEAVGLVSVVVVASYLGR